MFPRIDKGPIEYYLNIAQAFNTEKKRKCVRFTFQTNEEFHHFQYLITIDYTLQNGELGFVIKGLKPRGMTMPGVGPAVTSIDFFDLEGKFNISVSKPGQIVNSFVLSVKRLAPNILKDVSESDAFLQVSTAEVVGEL